MKQTAMQEIIDFIESQEYNFLNKEQLESCNKIKEKAEQLLELEKQQQGYSKEEVTILVQNIINEIEIRKQGIISKSETMSLHLLEGGCMAFESSQDVVKEQIKQFKNK